MVVAWSVVVVLLAPPSCAAGAAALVVGEGAAEFEFAPPGEK